MKNKISVQSEKLQELYKHKMTSKSSQSSHVLLKTWNILFYWSFQVQVKKSSTFFFFPQSCMLFSSMGTHLRFYFLYFVQSQPITCLMDVILLELFLHVKILKINPFSHDQQQICKRPFKRKKLLNVSQDSSRKSDH